MDIKKYIYKNIEDVSSVRKIAEESREHQRKEIRYNRYIVQKQTCMYMILKQSRDVKGQCDRWTKMYGMRRICWSILRESVV